MFCFANLEFSSVIFFCYLRCLKYKNFEMTERGEIEVKGKGKMHTYFLVRNKTACENEIMGRPIKDLDSGRESAQSFQEDRAEMMPSSHQSGRVNLTYLSLLKQMNVNSFTLNILFYSLSYSKSAREGPDHSHCNEVH